MDTATAFPQQAVVETTAGCNQDCIFCGRTTMERPKKTMKRWMWDRIVEEIGSESPLTELWPAFMGEATLLGDKLFDMIAHARARGCRKITLNTNGTRLNDALIGRLLEGNVDRFIVSCDAHTAATHGIVRPGRRTMGLPGIYDGILAMKDRMHREGLRRPIIEMQFSIFEQNEHEVEEFRSFWLGQGLTVKVRPKLYWSGNVEGGDHRLTLGRDREPCLWSMDTVGIHWNGNVVMCAVDCDGKYVAGNVEMGSIRSIWQGPLRWTRELQARRRFAELPEICRKCPDWRVKKARTYFPNDDVKRDYEAYIQLGRAFSAEHFWSPEDSIR